MRLSLSRGIVKATSLKSWLLACTLLFVTGFAHASPRKREFIMMTPTEGGGGVVGVRCGINGSKRQYNCIVDSGASNTLVSDRILKPKGPLKHMATGAGMMPVYEQAI